MELPLPDVFGRGGALKSSWYSDYLPSRDFPLLIDLCLHCRLNLDAFVTEAERRNQLRPGAGQERFHRCAGLLALEQFGGSPSGVFTIPFDSFQEVAVEELFGLGEALQVPLR